MLNDTCSSLVYYGELFVFITNLSTMDMGGIIAICIPIALLLYFLIDAVKETKKGKQTVN